MENKQDESKKLLLSLLVGGAIGAGVVYCVQSAQNRHEPLVKKIGKTIADIGGALENSNFNNAAGIMKMIGQKVPSSQDVFSNAVDWVNTGLALWKKFKKG